MIVFLVGIGSLVEGLLTGNVTILKMSSGEKVFLPLLILVVPHFRRRHVQGRHR